MKKELIKSISDNKNLFYKLEDNKYYPGLKYIHLFRYFINKKADIKTYNIMLLLHNNYKKIAFENYIMDTAEYFIGMAMIYYTLLFKDNYNKKFNFYKECVIDESLSIDEIIKCIEIYDVSGIRNNIREEITSTRYIPMIFSYIYKLCEISDINLEEIIDIIIKNKK